MIKTFFFARALRTIITVLLLFGIYWPHLASRRGGVLAIVAGAVATIVWYTLDNPFGINNIYVAVATPALVMLIDSGIRKLLGKEPDDATSMA